MKLKIPRDNGSRCQRFPKVSCLCFFFRRCAKLAATLKKKNTRWRRFHTPLCCSVIIFRLTHRRKNTEKKANVVAAVWGVGENLHQVIWRIWWGTGLFAPGRFEEFDDFICKIASAARNRSNSVPQTAATTFAFSSVKILLLSAHLSLSPRLNSLSATGDGAGTPGTPAAPAAACQLKRKHCNFSWH